VALAVFIAGGLISGTLGLNSLASLAATAVTAPPPTHIPIRMVPPTSVAPAPTSIAAVSSTRAPAVAPTHPPLPVDTTAWLYVAGGNLWEITGGSPFQLTNDGGISQAALGSDGLVFVERSRNASDLWLANGDGPPRALTRNAAASASQSRWASQPVFIPDRERLYLLGDFNKSSTSAGDLAVWELSLAQDPPIQITNPPAYAGGDQDVTVNPEDPHQIIFTRYVYQGSQLVEQLQWMDVTANTPIALTPADQSARQASYSPDAKEIAFVRHGSGSEENLYLADLQVSNGRAEIDESRQVVSGIIANPVWASDGKALGYLALTGDGFQLFSVDVRRDTDGTEMFGEPRQITSGSGLDATSRPVFLTSAQAGELREWFAAPPP
jgi:hypothetical protein